MKSKFFCLIIIRNINEKSRVIKITNSRFIRFTVISYQFVFYSLKNNTKIFLISVQQKTVYYDTFSNESDYSRTSNNLHFKTN